MRRLISLGDIAMYTDTEECSFEGSVSFHEEKGKMVLP